MCGGHFDRFGQFYLSAMTLQNTPMTDSHFYELICYCYVCKCACAFVCVSLYLKPSQKAIHTHLALHFQANSFSVYYRCSHFVRHLFVSLSKRENVQLYSAEHGSGLTTKYWSAATTATTTIATSGMCARDYLHPVIGILSCTFTGSLAHT